MFGQNKTPFGGGGFGTSNTTSTGFGTPAFGAQTPATGGLFGNTNTSTASSVFGGGNTTFGQPQQNTGFTFGQQTQQPATGGLFGQNTGATGGLFGTPNTATAFGAKPTTSFGGTTFGGTTGGGLFGNTTQQTPSLFGTNQTTGTGLFGFGATATPAAGTTVKFNAPTGTDTMLKNGVSNNINTRHQCITAMKEYESKSLEELRFEDYGANRKGKQGGTGLFGTSTTPQAPSFTSGFGVAQKPQTSNFSTSFGATGTTGGLFGQTQPQAASTGLFGQTKPGGLFGTTTTTASATPSLGFGTNTGTSLFGQTQQKPSLFSTPAASSAGGLFGTTNTSTTGFGATGFGASTGFGTPAATGGLFGAAKPAFGTATTSAGFSFGQPAQPAGGLFSKPATTGAGFGGFGLATNTFGTTNSFGAKPATGGFGGIGGFGATSGFGTAVSSNTGGFGTTGSSLFSQQNKPAFGGFGTTSFTGTNTGGFTGFGNTNTALNLTAANTSFGQPAAGAPNPEQGLIQHQLSALTYSPYGDSPLFRNLKDGVKSEEKLKPTNPAAQKAALSAASQYKVSPRPAARIKPKPLHTPGSGKSSLFDGLDEEESQIGSDTFVPRKSVKKLVIHKHSPSRDSSVILGPGDMSRLDNDHNTSRNGFVPENGLMNGEVNSNSSRSSHPSDRPINNELDDTIAILNPSARGKGIVNDTANTTLHDTSDLNLIDGRDDTPPIHPAGIILRRPGYYTIPSLDELADAVDGNGDCFVQDFTIGREGYGSVFFPGVTNLAGLNFDEIVHFRRKEVTVYPEDDKKPALGEELNKRAEVTLDCVWPVDKSDQSAIKSPERLQSMNYAAKIERASAKIGAKFIDYRPETGSWVFEVKHFSKYGLLDEDDDEPDQPLETDPKKIKLIKQATEKQLQIQKKQIKMNEVLGDIQPDEMPADVLDMLENEARQQEQPMQEEEDDNDADMADITREQMPEFIDYNEDDDDDDDQQLAPTSHLLATAMGLSAPNVQMMKASFFGDEDMDENTSLSRPGESLLSLQDRLHPKTSSLRRDSATRSGPTLLGGSLLRRPSSPKPPSTPQPRTTRDSLLKPHIPSSLLSRLRPSPRVVGKELTATEHMIIPSGMEPDRRADVHVNRNPIPLACSRINNKHKLVMDSACYMGRTCRVGWGPNLMMVHCGKPVSRHTTGAVRQLPSIIPSKPNQATRPSLSSYTVTIEKIHVSHHHLDSDDPTLLNNYTKALDIQLDRSQLECENNETCPKISPLNGIECLHKYAEQLQQEAEQIGDHHDAGHVLHSKLVWQLCVALWGDMDDVKMNDDVDASSYSYHMSRREAFSRWLESAAADKIQKEIQNVKFKGESHISAVLSHLSGRQIPEACRLAQSSGDHRLALLISQTLSSPVFRQLVRKQLANWNEVEADRFIDVERMKVYSLLAGCTVWPSSQMLINSCETLDWKRALALHLWYLCQSNSTIADALAEYETAFKGRSEHGPYCCSPYPPYLEENPSDIPDEMADDRRSIIYDCCYHLLKLYSQRAHRMERILAPTTSTPNHLDYRLSWHLLQALKSLGYTHLSEYHESLIHANYISQLETVGLWHWAIFVALHNSDSERREKTVRDLLNRHVDFYRTEKSTAIEQFLREKLNIPAIWLHKAKALKAHSLNMKHEEAWHLLKAKHWNKSHSILMQHIAPDCIINENTEYLMEFLSELSEHKDLVQGWTTAGQVFYDFIQISTTLQSLRQQDEPRVYELEALQPKVVSLCNRLNSLQCLSAKDRMCQAEMAKKTANLMHVLLGLQSQLMSGDGQMYVSARLLAPGISKLPLPEDYALQELRILTRNYMTEMTS
ncbi:nuclear pore complex protein Nup98-Nup96-like [Tubulanus polymorphus]|uniref:nuclear pore complex protein Nup98-Nup96-like n=1 Tax=Tubulanus polymorphus TaxID=672921 RepID=UPI003DA1D5BE